MLRSRGANPSSPHAALHANAAGLALAQKPSAHYYGKGYCAVVAGTVAMLVLGQHAWYRQQLSLLEQAGPIGYHLLNGRR